MFLPTLPETVAQTNSRTRSEITDNDYNIIDGLVIKI